MRRRAGRTQPVLPREYADVEIGCEDGIIPCLAKGFAMTASAATGQTPRALSGLRLQLFIALLLLSIEIVLGMAVNLFVKVPAGDKGTSLFAGFAAAITAGPVSLAIHAVVGTLIVLAAISVLIRAISTRRGLQIALAIIGLLAVFGAWTSGAGFVGDGKDSASFSMATLTAIAIAAYASALFAVPAVAAGTAKSEPAKTAPSK
jgi:hypothetical protein